MNIASSCDVAVVGAGAAGLAAAAECARCGLSAVVFDEQQAAGGQIYRAITTTPLKDRAVLGADYWHGEGLVGEFARAGAMHVPGATVWAVTRSGGGFEIGVSHDGVAQLVQAKQVVLATGALERPFPIPGWTLPGVMTAGAAQLSSHPAGDRAACATPGEIVLISLGDSMTQGTITPRIISTRKELV